MAKSWLLPLHPSEKGLFRKLSAAANDLALARQYGEFILKKGWDTQPYKPGNAYLQHSAFTTAMLMAYCRAFTGDYKLSGDFLNHYDAEERERHARFIKLRNDVYAHTDAETYDAQPVDHEHVTVITYSKSHSMGPEDVRALIANCLKMMGVLTAKRDEIRARHKLRQSNGGTPS